jgi:predicted nucleic acid-binding protein
VRLVLDSNLLVSGVIAAGLPRRLLDGAKALAFELCTSDVLLADLIAFGDRRDLLPLGSFHSIDIVTAREAAERLVARGKTP